MEKKKLFCIRIKQKKNTLTGLNMKQTKYLLTMASLMLTAFWLTGCANTKDEPQTDADTGAVEAVATEEAVVETPAFRWQTAIEEYLVKEIATRLDTTGRLLVPCYTVIAADSSDMDLITVKGDWRVWSYDIDGKTLVAHSMAVAQGLFVLKKRTDGYQVMQHQEIEEGRGIDESVQQIFGDNSDRFWEISMNEEYNESLRHAMLSEWVKRNNLPYTRLKSSESAPALPL